MVAKKTVAETNTENVVSSSNNKPPNRWKKKRRRRYSVSIAAAIPLVVCFAVVHLPKARSFFLSFSSWTASQRQTLTSLTPLFPGPLSSTHERSVLGAVAATTAVTEEGVAIPTTAESSHPSSSSSCSTPKRDVLASLFGSYDARDAFFEHDFGTNIVHIQREASKNNIDDLGLPCIVDGTMDMSVLFDSTNYVALRKRGSLRYLDKTSEGYDDFCAYIEDGGSAVIPVAEENVLVPFMEEIETSLHRQMMVPEDDNDDDDDETNCSVGINVYHSGPNAVALTRHCDQYDVFVLHLEGKKEWEIGVFGEGHRVDHLDPGALQKVASWNNVTLVPGDLLYIPKGVFHAATTAEGFESTTHATVGLTY